MPPDPATDVAVTCLNPRDVPAVRDLILAGLRERWGELDPSLNPDLDDFATTYASGVTLTAWRGTRLVGTGTMVPRDPDTAELLRMSTAGDCRRQGIASRILEGLLESAQARGVKRVVLETAANWHDARALYERHGFVLDREEAGELCRDAFYRREIS